MQQTPEGAVAPVSSAAPLNTLARLKLNAELAGLLKEKATIPPGPMSALKVARVSGQILVVLGKLGADLGASKRESQAFALEGGPEPVEQPRKQTAHLYDFDPTRKTSQRRKDNAAAINLLREIDKGNVKADALTDSQKEVLARYSGMGGNLVGADGLQGSDYEYYTPKPIAAGMWGLLGELGFSGGKVLDSCAGVGIFGATAPESAAIDAIELDETSGRINQLVNGGPGYSATISPFEAIASRTEDEQYDAVVSNIPFSSKTTARGDNYKLDPRYQSETIETYFILRSLEKLKPGGLAAFIVPPRLVSAKGGRDEKLRIALSYMAEFMGAYRLPNSVFGTADADTITDVIVLRKYGRDALEKIAELKQQNPLALVQANVQWGEFISGNYFVGEGRRFVLGEFIAKDPNKIRDVDRVVHSGSVADIAKMLRKFPGSRVDWAMLNATETEPITYNEGDTVIIAGQTMEMRGGKLVAIGKVKGSSQFDGFAKLVQNPVWSVTNSVSWTKADEFVQFMRASAQDADVTDWLRAAHSDMLKLDESERPAMWNAVTAGLAVVQVMGEHGQEPGFNYHAQYPALSGAMQATATMAKKGNSRLSATSKQALIKTRLTYDRKTGFDAVWLGQVATDVTDGQELSVDAKVEGLKYLAQGINIDVAKLKQVYGDDFDPIASDDWCVSADGKTAAKPDDYYIGNMGDFLVRIDAEIAAAEGPLKDKLLRQKAMARDRVDIVDPKSLRFNLFSPFVTIEEKAAFLRQFMHPAFDVGYDSDGEKRIVLEIKTDTEKDRQLKRFAEYLQRGTISTRTKSDEALANPELEAKRRNTIREMVLRANAQFDQWTKATPAIIGRIEAVANDPAKIYFRETEDSEAFPIEGFKQALHAYQYAEVKRRSRHFGGINGLDVGLGKTFTALACAQYVQSIGVKKKTIFVVPNAVLSNWRREAQKALVTTDDCLFVGLDVDAKSGDAKVSSSNYPRDFHKVLQNRHRKIFCTLEAFKALPLKDATIEAYESYLASVDPSFSGSDKKSSVIKAENALSKVTDSGDKSAALPFFEDMGIDSIVIDEAHTMKNSKTTVEFTGAKFLSDPEASDRGLDIQIKAWFIRGLSPQKDGVLGLTATPITNSPLEIYSMLCLTAGEERVHNMVLGARGADEFMDLMCSIGDEDETTIDGQTKSYRVFGGLQNVNILRQAMASVATIKTGEDVKADGVDLKLPEAPETQTVVSLPKETQDTLTQYRIAFRTAIMLENNDAPTPEQLEVYEAVAAKFGEPQALMANAFNLIGKMANLILDPELDERATFYLVNKADLDKAQAVIDKFNAKPRKETRDRPGPWTGEGLVSAPRIKKKNGQEVSVFDITVKAALTEDDRIVIDTVDTKTQRDFEALAEKEGLDLDVTISPKLAALIDNVQKEEAHPRSKSGRVKQIIFCDTLPMHNKIKRLLTKRAGIPASAIAFISGPTIKNPAQMQDIQDGFNAEGEANRYRVIIANKKAEVGINLQKGTQAIHHLTIGWTPDSQHQRNGRGVRQGNDTALVNIYHYDADGTFDEYKRNLTNRKSDWISSIMDGQGGNDVAITGGLTKEEERELAFAEGAADIALIQQRALAREKMARAKTARDKQAINFSTYQSQAQFIKDNSSAKKWAVNAVMAAYDTKVLIEGLESGIGSKARKAETVIKIQSTIADLRVKLDGMIKRLDECATFGDRYPSVADVLNRQSYSRGANAQRDSVKNGTAYIQVKEGSEIDREWQAAIAQAEAMQARALADFEEIGRSAENAYSANFVNAIKSGEASVIDGRFFARGMFVRAKTKAGEPYLAVTQSGTYLGTPLYPVGSYISDAIQLGAEFIAPGTPEYEEALNEAARIDDSMPEGLDLKRAAVLFSAIIPEVALRRTKATTISVAVDQVRMDSPMFPHLIYLKSEASPALRAIAKKQEGIVVEWDSTGYSVTIPASGPFTLLDRSESARKATIVRDLSDAAKGYGTPLTIADYAIASHSRITESGGDLISLLIATNPLGDHEEAINAATTEEEVLQVVKRICDAALATSVVIPDGFDYMGAISFGSIPMYSAAVYRTRAIKREAEAAEAARLAAERAASAPAPATATESPAVAAASSIRLTPWAGREFRVYFNGLPGLQKREGVYAYATSSVDRDWSLTSSKDMPDSRFQSYKEAIEVELIMLNGGKPVTTFERLKELAGVGVTPINPETVPAGDGAALTGTVAIRGKTKENRDVIKHAAGVVGSAARYVGNSGDPYWLIPASAWEWIKSNNEGVAAQLSATQA